MKLLRIFSHYFLILMWLQGLVLVIFDSKNFMRFNKNAEVKLSKIIGFGLIAISTILFLVAKFIVA